MQKCKHFCAALASLLVLEATNRKPEDLVAAAQVRIAVVIAQAHVVRVAAIVLCRTPEVRVVALAVVTPVVVPAAGRERREGEGERREGEGILVGDAAIRRPASRGLEHLACD